MKSNSYIVLAVILVFVPLLCNTLSTTGSPDGDETTTTPSTVSTGSTGSTASTAPPGGTGTTAPPGGNGTIAATGGTGTTAPPAGTGTTAPPGGSTTASANGTLSSWEGRGIWERTNLTQANLCILGNNVSIDYCKNSLKADVLTNFHPELKLNVTNGACVYITNGSAPNPNSTIRCAMKGTFVNKAGKTDDVDLHFYNLEQTLPANDIICISYWGVGNISKTELETPIPA